MNDLFRQEVFDTKKRRLEGAVVLRYPVRLHVAVAGLLFIFGAIILWLVLGSYARVVNAPGILVTSSPSAALHSPSAGVVKSLNVAEGSTVAKGAILALISVDRDIAKGQGTASLTLETINARLAINEQRRALAKAQFEAQVSQLQSARAAAGSEVHELDNQLSLQREIVASNDDMFKALRPVMERGFVSRVDYERRRQTVLSSRQALGQLQQQLIGRSADAAQAIAALSKAQSDYLTEIGRIDGDSQALNEARAETQSHIENVLAAPVSGRVTAVQTSPGRVVDPSVPLLSIVPPNSELLAEIYAPTSAIGIVSPGQEVRLLYDAYPYRQFGSFAGKVRSVSHDIIDPRRSEIPLELKEPVYKIIVELAPVRDRAGNAVQLKPGMTLRANLILERQSFIQWLLSPLETMLRSSS